MKTLMIYGGTFDPPHYGHINTALAVQNHLHFDRFVFLPCKTPVLKNATLASCKQRVQMLQLALQPYPEFEIDSRETTRNTPSFMVETLESFRHQLGEQVAITICLGTDAFKQLPQWHCWQKILKLSNILVIQRELSNKQELSQTQKNCNSPLPSTTSKSSGLSAGSRDAQRLLNPADKPRDEQAVTDKLLLTHETFDKNDLKTHAFGQIYRFNAGQYPISSSWLRNQMQEGYSIEAYLPASVYQYIKDQALYPLYPTS